MRCFDVSSDQIQSFLDDGYLIIESLLDSEEISLLLSAAKQDPMMKKHVFDMTDRQGKTSQITSWNHPNNDIWGMVSRSERVVDTMQKLIMGEVYHYHSKLLRKKAREGGAWEWHQDYGYWYSNGCLYPYMASCWIALSPANRANGCLQVIKGSHHVGRLEHGIYSSQHCADPDRVDQLLQRLEHVYCELEPGSAIFFHCNTLHKSDGNISDLDRWNLICCYNAARNNPYCFSHHPQYTPLYKVPDSAIKEIGLKFGDDSESFYKSSEASIFQNQ
ncbi:MAG: phytanoyl-CoA dioxygenase family protein [SAR324 cluster bacterium]|jgi:ectoine hydroxylase|nr:phytanoyl-CoA dioxygenase family protein [SAR324 cluster bacterium]